MLKNFRGDTDPGGVVNNSDKDSYDAKYSSSLETAATTPLNQLSGFTIAQESYWGNSVLYDRSDLF